MMSRTAVPPDPEVADPFRTADLRSRVLSAWSASSARFREDANAEDDLVRGAYRDRVVVELAQNAADAAARAGVAGHLVLTLEGSMLRAANTGAPLDAAGVESLSTLRASTKRGDDGATTGRFGVGFAAVLAVTDEPDVASTTGAVRWDAARARREVAAVEFLRPELDRRGGQVPVLRLPYPSTSTPPPHATTEVTLPLRDEAAVDLVRELLAEVDDALLLALPSLTQIVVEVEGTRRVVSDEGRWQVVRRSGRLEPHLLADRPVEERDRATWSVTWGRPLAAQVLPGTVHAPTPTDEPLGLPAMLVASFPLDPSRRHVAPGPLTDFLVGQAAAAYAELVASAADAGGSPLDLVPGPVPAGWLDALLRTAVMDVLRDAPVLRSADGHRVAPRDAVSVIGVTTASDLLDVLADVVSGLVPDAPVLERLGARRLRLADAVDLLADLRRPPRWWYRLYAALADGAQDPEALGALPVPLADGRVVRGPRGALVPDGIAGQGLDVTALGRLGLRLVHADAAHPLLLRLGATSASARVVLERPEVRQAVEVWDEDEDPAGLMGAVLALVAAAELRHGELPWLAALGLPDEAGDLAPADELVLPGSALAELAEPGALGVVGAELLHRWGPGPLAAVGVLSDLSVGEAHDVVLEPAGLEDDSTLPDLSDWVAEAVRQLPEGSLPPTARLVRGVRELDVVADDAWERVLERLCRDPDLRAVLLEPVAVDLAGGGRVLLPSYTSWWIRTRGLLHGRRPSDWALAGAEGLAGVFDELAAPPGTDPAGLAAAGVRTSLETLLAEPGGPDDLLSRLVDDRRDVPPATLLQAYRRLAARDPGEVQPPERVRVSSGVVLPASEVVVVDAAQHLQVTWPRPPLVVGLGWAAALAEVLDVATSGELLGDVQAPPGVPRPVPEEVRRLLPGGRTTWEEHDELLAGAHRVEWWVNLDGSVHACTVDGLSRGLAAAAGRWDLRLVVAAVLADPDQTDHLLAESYLED